MAISARGLKNCCSSRCPDMEGIETLRNTLLIITSSSVSRCPDMEGIETGGVSAPSLPLVGVSRCPDMEGIETEDLIAKHCNPP